MSIFVSALQELELQHGGPQDHQRHEDRAGVLGDRHQHPADQTHAERLNTHPGHRRDPDLIILTLQLILYQISLNDNNNDDDDGNI